VLDHVGVRLPDARQLGRAVALVPVRLQCPERLFVEAELGELIVDGGLIL